MRTKTGMCSVSVYVMPRYQRPLHDTAISAKTPGVPTGPLTHTHTGYTHTQHRQTTAQSQQTQSPPPQPNRHITLPKPPEQPRPSQTSNALAQVGRGRRRLLRHSSERALERFIPLDTLLIRLRLCTDPTDIKVIEDLVHDDFTAVLHKEP